VERLLASGRALNRAERRLRSGLAAHPAVRAAP
jgi:hypothetical protein